MRRGIDLSELVFFVSSVEGRLVNRFGTSTYIGASVDAQGVASFDTDAVTAIRRGEYERSRREYEKLIAAGDLKRRTREDFDAAVQLAETKAEEVTREQEVARVAAAPPGDPRIPALAGGNATEEQPIENPPPTSEATGAPMIAPEPSDETNITSPKEI